MGTAAISTDLLREKVIEVIADVKEVSPDAITMESTFEELGVDSLDGLNIIFELENAFNIRVPDDEALSVFDVRGVVQSLERLLLGGRARTAVEG
jgi:acyl carrier protein